MPEIVIPKAIQDQIDAENARVQSKAEAIASYQHPDSIPTAAEPTPIVVVEPAPAAITAPEPASVAIVHAAAAPKETMSTAPVVQPKESFLQKVEGDVKKAWTAIEKIGSVADKGLTEANAYMPEVEALAGIFFPPAVAALTTVQGAMQLALNTIAEIKQKSALIPAGLSGEQMTAQEIQLAGPAVLALLQKEGVPQADAAYVQNLLNVIVGILQTRVVAA